jgi:TetR/AcrR family transcriptional regulator
MFIRLDESVNYLDDSFIPLVEHRPLIGYDRGMSKPRPTPAAVRRRAGGRRAPDPAERRRDPERSRERILEAALAEFASKGFAGARVEQIAARAGVNKQLISYYFGGKQGLYQALGDRWRAGEAAIAGPELPLDVVIQRYLAATADQRLGARLLVWEGLEDGGEQLDDPGRTARMQQAVADLRRRQDAGELARDLDPARVLLALFAAAAAPVVLPQMVRSIFGADPTSEEFLAHYGDQLGRMVRALGPC